MRTATRLRPDASRRHARPCWRVRAGGRKHVRRCEEGESNPASTIGSLSPLGEGMQHSPSLQTERAQHEHDTNGVTATPTPHCHRLCVLVDGRRTRQQVFGHAITAATEWPDYVAPNDGRFDPTGAFERANERLKALPVAPRPSRPSPAPAPLAAATSRAACPPPHSALRQSRPGRTTPIQCPAHPPAP